MGQHLLPGLIEAGHHVVATTRSSDKVDALKAAGAEPVIMNGLDRESVFKAVVAAKPDVVIHQLTALSSMSNLKKFDVEFATTNRLRTAGTDNLLAAARKAGATRFVAQSYTGWNNERSGGPVKSEDDPLDPHPVEASRQTMKGIRHVEQAVTSAPDLAGIALRYGSLYGPGTNMAAGGSMMELVRRRKLPVVGGGSGIWSFSHVEDAARATVCALDNGAPGIYNIVDDEPAAVSEWLPFLAEAIGAKPPRNLPSWLVTSMIGEMGVSMMTQIRGASNAKAKRDLEWKLAYPTWREGFRTGLG